MLSATFVGSIHEKEYASPIPVQIFSVAILLYTPLVCNHPIAVPVLAAYSGVITRCTIVLVGFYRMVYPKLSRVRTVCCAHECLLKLMHCSLLYSITTHKLCSGASKLNVITSKSNDQFQCMCAYLNIQVLYK